jgi:general stress protein 26
MKTEEQTSAERSQLCQLIKHLQFAMLTTTDDDNQLVSRPMAPLEMPNDGSIWFFSDLKSAKVKQLRALNLAFTDADRGTYVSISGHGQIVKDRAAIKRLWTPAAKPWFPDGPDSPNLCLIKIVPEMAEYWDGPDSKMVRMFAMAASIVTGKPVGMGEHDVLTKLSVKSPDSASV